ncbi:type I pullulanase [Bacillus sp. FJAT-50079]|nr:type I pullulanase [Bacillus sp. FJAT-50079]
MNTNIAWHDDVHLLTVKTDNISLSLHSNESIIVYWEDKNKSFQAKIENLIDDHTCTMSVFDELPIGENLFLIWNERRMPIYPRGIVRTSWFDDQYFAHDAILGATCTKKSTKFSIWAPTATEIKLYLNSKNFLLKKQTHGVWEVVLYGDWHGFAYDYEITVNGKKERVNDPYAKAMLANSEKSVVVDFSRTEQMQQKRPMVQHLQDAIIYELHVRDATIHPQSGVINKGTFLGLTEKETKTEQGFSTALAYVKELGCTHVQLLPINDFARVNELLPMESYNWGYDPLYFQVPEGSYSLSPNDPIARINECKKMIDSFHQEGLSVILDVVYNHVFIMKESPFEKLVPGYYFRYHDDGTVSNGTGVGNDIATERKMVRKFILDTINFWLGEYKVDGFRFDLMGVIDVETMKSIYNRSVQEDVPIMLLGEGWELSTALASEKKATSSQSHQLPGIRFFNDLFRDSLKGNLFHNDDLGFVNGNGRFIERLPHLVTGSALEEFGIPFAADVDQTINYVECHDNHTLWDRLLITNRHATERERKKMHQLASGLTLLSQGVPFIHAGQEWFRTKQGDENSYISSDEINQLDWEKRELEDEYIKFIKTLIAIRKKHWVFRLRSKQEIRRRFHLLETPFPVFAFALFGNLEDISVYANPSNDHYDVRLPSSATWQVMATNDRDRNVMHDIKGEFTSIGPYEFIVLKKSRENN